jgi:hypothetical protein
MRRHVVLGGIGAALGVGILMIPITAGADPSPGDSAGLNTAPLTPAVPGKSIQSIPIPNQFTPNDVSSPLDQFKYGLQQDFPDVFGGLTLDSSGHYVVEEVGSNAAFESAAQQRFDAIPGAMHVSVAASSLRLSFVSVGHSLVQLDATRQHIADQLPTSLLHTSVWGVGIDEANNRVLINSTANSASGGVSDQPSDSTEQSLAATYGASSLEFKSGGQPTSTANRYADSPPWNGGDQLLLPTLYGTNGCTSGPGVHVTSSGGHALLTAGHCTWIGGTNFVGNIDAYNTWSGGPVYNSSTLVGTVALSSIGGNSTPWLDIALIPTASSNITWTALYNRTYMTGWATPPVGGSVCSEGSYGLEICGTIIATNQTVTVLGSELPGGYEVVEGLDEMNQPIHPGDSGATVWENSVFGPLVTGTNVSSGSTSFSEDIDTSLYIYSQYYGSSVVVNTVSNP